MTQDTTIDWVVNHDPTGGVYIGMLPILRTLNTEQITSVAEFNWGGTVVDVSAAGHVGASRSSAPWQVQIYDPTTAIDFLMSYNVTGTTPDSIFVSNAAPYNKVYLNHYSGAVVAPDTWRTIASYRWLGMYR